LEILLGNKIEKYFLILGKKCVYEITYLNLAISNEKLGESYDCKKTAAK